MGKNGIKILRPRKRPIRRQISTFQTSSSRLRLRRVISEMHSYGERTRAEIRNHIKTQAKELGWFFSLFVAYVMFGSFVFFYIEECSGASMAHDGTTPSLHEKIVPVKYINLSNTCDQLFTGWITILQNVTRTQSIFHNVNSTQNALDNVSNAQDFSSPFENRSSFLLFSKSCEDVVRVSADNYVVPGHERKCVIDAFQVLKYAEFCIFSLLTVGYGNTVPVTIIGRYLLIVYGIIGVPIAVTMYSVAGKLLILIFTLAVRFVIRKITKSEPGYSTERLSVLALAVASMFIIILIGCGVTTRDDMENLSFHTSIYFWFVSLTTIGYGDVHFDRDKHLASPHFLLLSAGNLLFGLGIVAAVIEAFAMALEKRGLDNINITDPTATNNQVTDNQENRKDDLPHLTALNESWVKKSVLAGGIALDLNGPVSRRKITQTLLDGGFVFQNDQNEFANISCNKDEYELSECSNGRSTSTTSNTSYFHA